MHPGTSNLQQGGLTSSVGPQNDPAFSLFDLPGQVIQEGLIAADHAHGSQFENITHSTRH